MRHRSGQVKRKKEVIADRPAGRSTVAVFYERWKGKTGSFLNFETFNEKLLGVCLDFWGVGEEKLPFSLLFSWGRQSIMTEITTFGGFSMLITGICAASLILSVLLCLLCPLSFWLLPVLFVGAFLGFAILAFLFLWLACAVVSFDKPQEHDSKFYRFLTKLYIQALPRLIRVHIHKRGLENLHKEGRFILMCNHQSNADPVLLLEAFPDAQLAFISKRENQDMFLIGKIMHKLMCQMINRENDREALKTILKCIQLLKDDEVNIGVFPEGYCTTDGRLQHFRAGVFKIAQKTKVPIVVCTLKNTAEIFVNLPRLKPTHVQLHLVGIIRPEEYEGLTTVQISDMAFKMMLDDMGPEFAPLEKGEDAT